MMTASARPIRRLTLTLLLVLATPALFAQPDSAPNGDESPAAVESSGWALIRPLPVVTLQIRKAVGYLMLVPAATLFLLYLFRPRPYILAWIVSWLAAAVMLLILSVDSAIHVDDRPDRLAAGRLALTIWSISALTFGAALHFGGRWFRSEATLPRHTPLIAAALLAWSALAATLLDPAAVLIPAFVLIGVWQTKGAIAYLRAAGRYRFVGALLCGIGTTGVVAVNVSAALVAAIVGGQSQASTSVSYLNAISASLLVLGMHLLVFEDVIDELRAAAAELARGRDEMKTMAVTDPLTRCYNRRFFDEIAHHEVQQHRRYGVPLSLLYLDVDHFKAINDTRGHHTGDEVLQTLGALLRQLTRQADYVFRWGGDEFLVLLSADATQAAAKAAQIREAFLESVIVRDLPDGVDLSIGCVTVPVDTEHLEPLIEQADREMYRRKRALAG